MTRCRPWTRRRGSACFDALLGDRGVLRDAAVVLVTHGTHYLRRADRIIVLDVDGGVAFQGTWPEAERAAATRPDDSRRWWPRGRGACRRTTSSWKKKLL